MVHLILFLKQGITVIILSSFKFNPKYNFFNGNSLNEASPYL